MHLQKVVIPHHLRRHCRVRKCQQAWMQDANQQGRNENEKNPANAIATRWRFSTGSSNDSSGGGDCLRTGTQGNVSVAATPLCVSSMDHTAGAPDGFRVLNARPVGKRRGQLQGDWGTGTKPHPPSSVRVPPRLTIHGPMANTGVPAVRQSMSWWDSAPANCRTAATAAATAAAAACDACSATGRCPTWILQVGVLPCISSPAHQLRLSSCTQIPEGGTAACTTCFATGGFPTWAPHLGSPPGVLIRSRASWFHLFSGLLPPVQPLQPHDATAHGAVFFDWGEGGLPARTAAQRSALLLTD